MPFKKNHIKDIEIISLEMDDDEDDDEDDKDSW